MTFNYCPPKKLQDLKSITLPNGKRHYLTPNGIKLPSVTTVVGSIKKQYILEWRERVGEEVANKISKIASGRGTSVHLLCEKYLNNEPSGTSMPDALEMFKSIRPALDRITDIYYNEQVFWSEKVGMAGRVDCIAHYEGELSVIDFKTSSKIKKSEDIQDYFWQTTAYALMHEDQTGIPIDNLVVIMAVVNEKPLIFKEKTRDHIAGLVKAIKFYREQNAN